MANIPSIDWSRFMVEIPLDVDQKRIEDAWTTRQGIESWFLRSAEFISKDGVSRTGPEAVQACDTYTWTWHGWPDDVRETGLVLAPPEGAFFSFSFGAAGMVTVALAQKGGHRILVLSQHEIPEDEAGRYNWHVGCKTGWTFYLANLKCILLGGPDLRNMDPELSMD